MFILHALIACLGFQSLQTGEDTQVNPNCGAYALWVAACRVGFTRDLEDVAKTLGTFEDNGTTLLSLKLGAEATGLSAAGYLVEERSQLDRLPLPAILPIRMFNSRNEQVPHFVVLLNVHEDTVTVVNPPYRAEQWSILQLCRVWDGPAVSIAISGPFPKREPVWLRYIFWGSCVLVVVVASYCLKLIWYPVRRAITSNS